MASRYDDVEQVAVTLPSGERRLYITDREPITVEDIGDDFFIYEVVTGDTLPGLAFTYGSRSRAYWVIADINQLADPLQLVPGQRLVIPGRAFLSRF